MSLHQGEEIFFAKGERHHYFSADGITIANAICADTVNSNHARESAEAGASVYIAGVLVTPNGYDADSAIWAKSAADFNLLVAIANYNQPSGGMSCAGKSGIWYKNTLLVKANETANALVMAEYRDGTWVGEVHELLSTGGLKLDQTDSNTKTWRNYYDKALKRPHSTVTELAIDLNESVVRTAIDCGCGTGCDIDYLSKQGYNVYGFDVNPDSVEICETRFKDISSVEISQSSFEEFIYPVAGVVIANSSLFFADPTSFNETWRRIESCLAIGGVFAGDFMGVNDTWANNYRSPTSPLTEAQVKELFSNFEIVDFTERDEEGKTALGLIKHWHTFSVVAIKRQSRKAYLQPKAN